MDEEQQFAPAVAALERRLHAAERRRRELSDALAQATAEVRLARLALESIASLTGKSDWVPRGLDTDPQPGDASPLRRRAESSTDRVVELLRSEPRPWTREEVYTAFRLRGWSDDWSDPEAAIRMAIKRALEHGAIAPSGPGSYIAKQLSPRSSSSKGVSNVDA